MPHTRVRARRGGIHEIARIGRLHELAVAFAVACALLPAVAVAALGLLTVIPLVVVAVPAGVVALAAGAVWSATERRRRVVRPGHARTRSRARSSTVVQLFPRHA